MSSKLLVFDSHPVQYRAPVFRKLAELLEGNLEVVYATDCSVRGHVDQGFGINLSWDEPLLEGYRYRVLHCTRGQPLRGFSSLTGAGIGQALREVRPRCVMLTGLNYRFDWVARWHAHRRGIPVWIRQETQDDAFERSRWKARSRSLFYSVAYRGISHFFTIGELNTRHYRRHLVGPRRLSAARYATVDRFAALSRAQKEELRGEVRAAVDADEHTLVVGFVGKLIPKKDPELLLEMARHLEPNLRERLLLYFVGSGELDTALRDQAATLARQTGLRTYFAGFVNQTQLAGHYLAMDQLVLPSRRMGETWGLVANEALQAGCGVIVSEAVGCHADFQELERFTTIPVGDARALASSVAALSRHPRDFDWAREPMERYSIDSVARAIAERFHHYTRV